MDRIALTVAAATLSFLPMAGSGCQEAPSAAAGPMKPMIIPVEGRAWSGEGFSGRQIISRHYDLYTTSTSEGVVSCLPGFLEAAYENYLDLTGLPDLPDLPKRPLARRMPVYMMATRQEWAALTRSVAGAQAELYLSIQAGGYCHQGVCVYWDMGGVAGLSVAAHEGLHQFLARRLRQGLPMWLEEGLCAAAEGYQVHGQSVRFTPRQNASRFHDLRQAIVEDRWIPLPRLLTMDAGDALRMGWARHVVGYYGQLWALVEFARSDPDCRRGMMRLVSDAERGRLREALQLTPAAYQRLRGQGRAYNQAVSLPLFRHYITSDLAGFERRYRAFAAELVRLDPAASPRTTENWQGCRG